MSHWLRFTSATFALTLGFFAFGSLALAEESAESKAKIQDVNPDQNVAPGEDVDEEITNNYLRAQSGSKSKYSISTAWAYYGGSVNMPLAEKRPNINVGSNNTANAFLAGDVNGKYAFDQRHAVTAGFGLRWITPLYGSSKPAGYDGTKVDADNPVAQYQYIYKWAGIQSVLQMGPTMYTAQDQRALGYTSDWNVTQNNMYEVGHSGLSIGFEGVVEYQTFDKSKNGVDKDGDPLAPQQTDYKYSLYPIIEYQLTSKINLRTLTGAIFEHTRAMDNTLTFSKDKVYQSFGVGISVTRDFFLYPSVQFIPDQMRASQTNVGIASNINLF